MKKRHRDYFKALTGKDKKDVFKRPSRESTVSQLFKQARSNYPLRLLGSGATEGDLFVAEEERYVNFHILGSPGEGKSKFIEYHIQKDIDLGNGLCLLDPSEGGKTVQDVLAYCQKKNLEKVILIDPSLISKYKKIPQIAPLNPKKVKRSVDDLMEALSILFDADYKSMRRIRRYLKALLRIFATQNLTPRELKYFSDYHRDINERMAILGNDRDSSTIRNLFRSEHKFDTFFSSTINMMDVLWQEPLVSILGNKTGINFVEAVAEGYIILVNLSPYHLTQEESELLGIIIVSQIIQAVDALYNNGWRGVHYLYIDEASRFATPQIDTLLSQKRKAGLSLVLAHHFFSQFENKRVMDSIINNARIKVMFNTANPDDRLRMVKSLGYGGDIPPLLASYTNQDLPQQYAIIKKNKEKPVRVKIPDVKTPPKASEDYIKKIFNQSFYKSVTNQENAPKLRKNPKGSQRRKTSDADSDKAHRVSRRTGKTSLVENFKKSQSTKKGRNTKE